MNPYTVVVIRADRLGGDIYVADHVRAHNVQEATALACAEAFKADKADFKDYSPRPARSEYHALVVFSGWHCCEIQQPRPESHRE